MRYREFVKTRVVWCFLVIAVTLLTSLDDADLKEVGQRGPAGDQVKRLAALTQASGLDGEGGARGDLRATVL